MKALSVRHTSAAMACALLFFSACSGDADPQTDPAPSTPSVSTPPAAATSTPSPTWQDDYSPDELQAYDEALGRWSEYEQMSAPIWQDGKVTDAARELFQKYFVSPVWQQYLDRLQTYESAHVKVAGLPTILWSKAVRIATSPDGGSVAIQQCVDYSTQVVTQAGRPIAAISQPAMRTAVLDRLHGHSWLLQRIKEPTTEKFTPCQEDGQ